jgi:undecaprenyl-diphosphatase
MDQKLLFLINREWTSPALDRAMALMSSLDAWMPVLVIAAVFAVWRGGFRARAFVFTVGVVIAVGDGLVASNLKRVVDRPRPYQSIDNVRQIDLANARPRLLAIAKPVRVRFAPAKFTAGNGRSFPSAHTMNTMSAALVTTLFYRRRGWLAFVPASLVSYSRIYIGSHWPSDVAASIPLAFGISLLVLAALDWLWRKGGARALPQIHLRHPTLIPA